jgi:hypothetical protein
MYEYWDKDTDSVGTIYLYFVHNSIRESFRLEED